jgi:hypothetical protein
MSDFKISKKYKNTDWNNLNLTDDLSNRWEQGIEIIKDRFESRFFTHIDKIKGDKFSGFVIMSIDCLIVETLMQFYLGLKETQTPQSKAFQYFFRNSPHFQSDFKTNIMCQIFYNHFRCGLLHQAETKQKSRIKIRQTKLLCLVNDSNINDGLIIDREQFHAKLLLEFKDYIKKLEDNKTNFRGENLRKKAILKMDMICK